MRPTRRAVLAATVSSIALAGCSGDGDETPEPGDGDDGGDSEGDGSGSDGEDATPTRSPTVTESPAATTADSGESPTATTADSEESPTATAAGATVQVRSHPDLGDILVDSAERTLYMFDSDTQGEGASTCSGGCADAWPPLTVDGEPAARADVTAELTTFEREEGSMQVAANGWPLYYYASDTEPGAATGQGASDVWWVLDPAGRPVRRFSAATPTVTATSTDTSGGGGGPY